MNRHDDHNSELVQSASNPEMIWFSLVIDWTANVLFEKKIQSNF